MIEIGLVEPGESATDEQVLLALSTGEYLSGNIEVDIDTIVSLEREAFLDHISERLVGSEILMDIGYKVIGSSTEKSNGAGWVVINVWGDVSEVAELRDLFIE